MLTLERMTEESQHKRRQLDHETTSTIVAQVCDNTFNIFFSPDRNLKLMAKFLTTRIWIIKIVKNYASAFEYFLNFFIKAVKSFLCKN